MSTLTLRERISLWLWANEGAIGMTLILGVGLVLGIGILIANTPLGPSRPVPGVIVGIWGSLGKSRATLQAEVRLPDNTAHTMRMIRGNACVVGDRVVVLESPRVWGVDRSLSPEGCNR